MDEADLWVRALADAAIDGADARLYFAVASLPRGGLAEAFGPGQPTPDGVLSDTDKQDSVAHRSAFRLVVRAAGLPRVVVWGIVRHELQHCVQQLAFGFPISRVGYAIDAALLDTFGHRAGVNALYHEVPTEADANVAAADFARRTFDAECDTAGAEWDVLVTQRPVREPLETLKVRQACFAAAVADPYAQVSSRQLDGPLMDVCSLLPSGREQWERITSDPELKRLTASAFATRPSDAAIAAASRPSTAWSDTRARLLAAYERACELM